MHAAHDGGAGNAARSLSCGLSSREEGEEGRRKMSRRMDLFFFFFSFPESIDLIRGLEKWIEDALHRKLAVDERRNRRIEIGCDIYIHV